GKMAKRTCSTALNARSRSWRRNASTADARSSATAWKRAARCFAARIAHARAAKTNCVIAAKGFVGRFCETPPKVASDTDALQKLPFHLERHLCVDAVTGDLVVLN